MIKQQNLINIINVPLIKDDATLLVFEKLLFPIKRSYIIMDTVSDLIRGKHAHFKNHQILFCVQGSVKIILDDGLHQEEVFLDKPNSGIELPPMIWHEMSQFQKNTILLVYASELYDSKDYIRDYDEFKRLARERSNF